jgi:hypothetical protein
MYRWVAAGVAIFALACDAAAPPAVANLPARVRRLSVREYVRTVQALTGVSLSPDRFLADSLDTEFDSGPASLSVQPEQAGTYEQLAWEIAGQIPRKRLIGNCNPIEDPGICRQQFYAGFVTYALRRPLADDERARYDTLFDLAMDGGSFSDGLEAVTAAVLESPSFLYRAETGTQLDPYQHAAALSYALTGLPPDAELLGAAAQGPLDLHAQAKRLLATDAARDQMGHFLDEWMGTVWLGVTNKDPGFYPSYPRGPMIDELDQFYKYIMIDSPGRSLDELLGSTVSFVDPTLAALYGVDVDVNVLLPNQMGPMQVELDPDSRRGIFTRAGFLTVHSGYDSSNPIARGVFIRTAILCAPPPAPPPNIPRAPSDPPTMHTTRARYHSHDEIPFCQSCHAAIDGVGFGFEQFDGIGQLRIEENGEPVDTSGNLIGTDVDGPFLGASELADKLRGSRQVAECLARQLFRYTTGAAERPEDEPFIKRFAAELDARTPLTDAAVALIASQPFQRRAVSP